MSRVRAERAFLWTLACAFLVAGIVFRLVQFFAARSLWLDESMLALNIASRSFGELLRPLDYNQVAPPLFLWLARLGVRLGGTNEMALYLYQSPAFQKDPAQESPDPVGVGECDQLKSGRASCRERV